MGLLDVVATFVRDYEERNVEIPESSAADALRFMMDRHQLRQVDLAELFGSQSNVSESLQPRTPGHPEGRVADGVEQGCDIVDQKSQFIGIGCSVRAGRFRS